MKRLYTSLILLILHFSILQAQDYKLFEAVINNQIDTVKQLLVNGTDPNILTDDYVSPLMYAVDNGTYHMVELLLKFGSDPDIIPRSGYPTALENAIKLHYNDIVELLLKKDANPNLEDSIGNTPMWYAITYKNYPAIVLLVDYNAKINDKILQISVEDDTAFNLLLEATDIDYNFSSILKYVIKHNNKKAFNTLVKYLNQNSFPNESPINIAAIYGRDTTYITTLLKIGYKPDKQSFYATLVNFNLNNYKLLSNITGKKIWYPVICRFSTAPSLITSIIDLQLGGYIGIWDCRYNINLRFGANSRLWHNRVWLPIAENKYLQLWQQKQTVFINVSKAFLLNRWAFAPSATAYFQNVSYRGYNYTNKFLLKYSPGVSIFYILQHHWLARIDYFYFKQEVLPKNPNFIMFSVEYFFKMF